MVTTNGRTLLKRLAALTFLLEVLLLNLWQAGFPAPGWYFAGQWTISYAGGFTRRGMLGELLRLLHLDNGNYILITAIAWAITIALFCVFTDALIRLLEPLRSVPRLVLFTAVLLSPATTGILVQTVADPIQFIVLLYLGLTLFLLKPDSNVLGIVLAFTAFGAVSILIHEASLFFVGPSLFLAAYLIGKSKVDRAALLGYVLGALPMLLLTIHATENHTVAAVAQLHLGHTSLGPMSKIIDLRTFRSLLMEQNSARFHSGVKGYLLFVRNAVGALTLPLFLSLVLGRTLGRRVSLVLALSVALSAPLWLIAVDCGRFGAYAFLLTLISFSRFAASNERQTPRELPLPLIVVLPILAGLTTSNVLTNYTVKGLGGDNRTMVAALLLCGFGGLTLLKWKETESYLTSSRFWFIPDTVTPSTSEQFQQQIAHRQADS